VRRPSIVEVEGRRLLSLEAAGEPARLVPLTAAAAAQVRELLPELRPRPLGTGLSSFGFGDRLGLATAGHVRALRASASRLAPVFAQQSARELERTGRTWDDVLAAAIWGALESGWTAGYGADADHLRTEAEVEAAVTAGFTMLTLDPSAHVDADAGQAEGTTLERSVRALPWDALEDDWDALRRRHAHAGADELGVARAAATFGAALAHVTTLSRTAARVADGPLDVEVSVDETDVPTSVLAHRFLAIELERLGVLFTGLAPCFPGRWEKGVDIDGDLDEIASAFAAHAQVASEHGGYKLSVHSGSDKLAVYPLLGLLDGPWHVKTSGTSYLEGLRVVASVDPPLFREILTVAGRSLEQDRRSYAIAPTARVPDGSSLEDAALPALLDDPDVRQCLHVTFGTVLSDAQLGAAVRDTIERSSATYAELLERHFVRHLEPLGGLR
jgi:tagaturonate epimerase